MSEAAASRPTVLVFATGGTIGMRETDAGLAPDPAFPEVLERMVGEICAPLGVEPRVNHLLPAIDSANAEADTAPRIARAIRARVRTHKPRGVVILHGTDTLAYSAARLAFELSDLGCPVVVTGSQFAHGAIGTDAGDNLSLAIRAAVRASATAPVSIAFGGKLLPAVRTEKFDTEAREAFRAERPLMKGPAGIPQIGGSSRPRAARVLAYRFVPGVTAEDLRCATLGAPDALVLECYGTGNAPMGRPGMLGALREISSRMPVIAITQCASGAVDLSRYVVGRELAAAGVIDGSDLTREAAIGKVGFLLDHGVSGPALRELMETNLVGECRGR